MEMEADEGYESADGFEGFSNPLNHPHAPCAPELQVPFRNLDTGEVMTLSQIADLPFLLTPNQPSPPSPPLHSSMQPHPPPLPNHTLSSLPTLSSEVTCCGYLWKRGHKLGQLARRWYVLQPAVGLFYFTSALESVHDPSSRRLVDLQGAR